MLFHTFEFALFFVVVFLIYLLIGAAAPRARVWFLIVVSFFFYGAWDWRFCGLLLGSALFNHYAALAIEGVASSGKRKAILATTIAANLFVLGTFKYLDFFVSSLNDLLFRMGLSELPYFIGFILPVGISFFTFQSIAYVVDVYRCQLRASRKISETLLFIALFPQLVAGPIVRAKTMLPQIRMLAMPAPGPRRIALGFAAVMIVSGLFKKMVMANHLATSLVDEVFFDPASYGTADLLLAAYGYTVQIYCDFSGYSDMAIGFSALLGFVIPTNFNQPFRADSIRDFWRRWHISLSTWLRDYLYIPLGGNRAGKWITRRNLFFTMLLGGLWHGAAWNFVIWGALHSAFLIGEHALRAMTSIRPPRWLRILIVFHLVVLTFVVFRIESMPLLWDYIAGFGRIGVPTNVATPFLMGLILFGIGVHLIPQVVPAGARLAGAFPWPLTALLGAVAVTVIAGLSPPGITPFIYFQF